jgi:hypothetical protein
VANKHQAEGYAQDPHGWYREPPECVDALFHRVDFRGALIWDPCCGTGNTLDVAKRHGHDTVGSDIVDRGARHRFYRSNFLLATKWPQPGERPLSLVFNPPYNAPTGTTEGFILRALDLVPFDRMAVLVPANFPFGQDRYRELFGKHPPSHVAFLPKRPSMPPGAEVERLAAQGKDFKGGKVDFLWLIWTAGGPYQSAALWLDWEPPAPPSLGRTRPGSRSPSASAPSKG